jgi:hypothetical protein
MSPPMPPRGTRSSMVAKALTETMKRAASWPAQAQEELAGCAEEIEAALRGGVYRATDAEHAGIDRELAPPMWSNTTAAGRSWRAGATTDRISPSQ